MKAEISVILLHPLSFFSKGAAQKYETTWHSLGRVGAVDREFGDLTYKSLPSICFHAAHLVYSAAERYPL